MSKRRSRLNREQLYMMATAKAQIVAAEQLASDAAGMASIALPGSVVAIRIREACAKLALAREAMFARLDGEASDGETTERLRADGGSAERVRR